MNLKTAKRLRATARTRCLPGAPYADYVRHRDGSVRLSEFCVRSHYQRLKHAARRTEHRT